MRKKETSSLKRLSLSAPRNWVAFSHRNDVDSEGRIGVRETGSAVYFFATAPAARVKRTISPESMSFTM